MGDDPEAALNHSPMSPSDFSVVVQGPANAQLADTAASVRRVLPGAQLIVSTWRGADLGGIDADEIVLNDDPGSADYRAADGGDSGKPFNTNRMITSTRNGLARADRPYAIKLRNDTPLVDDAFVDWIGVFADRHPDLQVFSERILTASIATRPSSTMPGYLFHPSDCVHVGRTDDVRELWDAPLIDEAANAGWLLGRPRTEPDLIPGNWARYFNEQTLWLSCLRRNGFEVDYDHTGLHDEHQREASDRSIVNNFVVLEPWQLGIGFPKFSVITRQVSLWQYLWFDEWHQLYRRHCVPAAVA
jgi:hypothetical protein